MEITLKIDGIDVVANSVESGEMNHDAGAAHEYSGASVDGNHAAADSVDADGGPPPGWLVAAIETAEAEAAMSSLAEELGAAVDGGTGI